MFFMIFWNLRSLDLALGSFWEASQAQNWAPKKQIALSPSSGGVVRSSISLSQNHPRTTFRASTGRTSDSGGTKISGERFFPKMNKKWWSLHIAPWVIEHVFLKLSKWISQTPSKRFPLWDQVEPNEAWARIQRTRNERTSILNRCVFCRLVDLVKLVDMVKVGLGLKIHGKGCLRNVCPKAEPQKCTKQYFRSEKSVKQLQLCILRGSSISQLLWDVPRFMCAFLSSFLI